MSHFGASTGLVVLVAGLALSFDHAPQAGATSARSARGSAALRGTQDGATAATPCADTDPLRRPYFGDLHVHTRLSYDGYAWGARADPSLAYRFAKGDPVEGDGRPGIVQLARPLDFAAITDHAEYLGETSLCTSPGSPGYDSEICQSLRGAGSLAYVSFASPLFATSPARLSMCTAGGGGGGSGCSSTSVEPDLCVERARTVWQQIQDAAHEAYEECGFTTFVGYEWSAAPDQRQVHRNVLFRSEVVPEDPVSYFEEQTPYGLWQRLRDDCLEGAPGCDVLAVAHSSNLSGGRMFASDALTPEAAALGAALEPLVEIIQHKGSSECRPGFGTNDEQCAFEQVTGTAGAPAVLSYVRSGLGEGLVYESREGVNPFEKGFTGGTDTHFATGAGATDEASYTGHLGANEDTAEERLNGPRLGRNPGGLTVAWAEQNTREAIFDALERRETYATSGTRPVVRFFGGWAYDPELCSSTDMVEAAYAGGVPMGGDLPPGEPGQRPVFVLSALRDPGSALLQRLQIVKGWVEDGQAVERAFEVGGDPRNGASVDLETCTPLGPGFEDLCTVWSDPDFDPAANAFYYARVLENPTCRWSRWECLRAEVDCAAAVPAGYESCCDADATVTIQERAWSSPIWHHGS